MVAGALGDVLAELFGTVSAVTPGMAAVAPLDSVWPCWAWLVPAEAARLIVPMPATVPGMFTVLAVPTPFRAARLPVALAATAETGALAPVDVCRGRCRWPCAC